MTLQSALVNPLHRVAQSADQSTKSSTCLPLECRQSGNGRNDSADRKNLAPPRTT